MAGTVKTTARKTVITDVSSLSYRNGRDSLALAAQAAAHALGRDETYPILKGLSALAFRLMFPADWHRYTPDALCGFDHTSLLFDALGLTVETTGSTDQETSRGMIIESIGQGYPVLALHLMDWEDWGVIAGFGFGGERLFCRTPHDGGDLEPPTDESSPESEGEPAPQPAAPRPYARHKHWPNMLIRITGEQAVPDRLELIRRSLRAAAEQYDTRQYGSYYSGKLAYLSWMEGLRDSGWYAAQGEQEGSGYAAWVKGLRRLEKENIRADRAYDHPYLERAHVNAWRLESLIDARIAAGSYLNNLAMEFFRGPANSAIRMHVQQASIRYNWLVSLLISIRPYVPWDDELDQAPWTQAMREQQADLLSSARFVEEQGVLEIKAALEEIEKSL